MTMYAVANADNFEFSYNQIYANIDIKSPFGGYNLLKQYVDESFATFNSIDDAIDWIKSKFDGTAGEWFVVKLLNADTAIIVDNVYTFDTIEDE